MEFTLDQMLALGSFALALMAFSFTVVKYFNVQVHSRLSQIKTDIEQRLEHIEDVAVTRNELSNSVTVIKDIVSDMKTDQHRMTVRMDEFTKWFMVHTQGDGN